MPGAKEPRVCDSTTMQSTETESRDLAAGVKGRKQARDCQVTTTGNKEVLKLIVVMAAQLCEYTKSH